MISSRFSVAGLCELRVLVWCLFNQSEAPGITEGHREGTVPVS